MNHESYWLNEYRRHNPKWRRKPFPGIHWTLRDCVTRLGLRYGFQTWWRRTLREFWDRIWFRYWDTDDGSGWRIGKAVYYNRTAWYQGPPTGPRTTEWVNL